MLLEVCLTRRARVIRVVRLAGKAPGGGVRSRPAGPRAPPQLTSRVAVVAVTGHVVLSVQQAWRNPPAIVTSWISARRPCHGLYAVPVETSGAPPPMFFQSPFPLETMWMDFFDRATSVS